MAAAHQITPNNFVAKKSYNFEKKTIYNRTPIKRPVATLGRMATGRLIGVRQKLA